MNSFLVNSREETAFLEKEDEAVRYFSYCALVNALAYPNLFQRIEKQKCSHCLNRLKCRSYLPFMTWKRWNFSGKRGVHEYGAKLGERISELEADIYERAGGII